MQIPETNYYIKNEKLRSIITRMPSCRRNLKGTDAREAVRDEGRPVRMLRRLRRSLEDAEAEEVTRHNIIVNDPLNI